MSEEVAQKLEQTTISEQQAPAAEGQVLGYVLKFFILKCEAI